jgi:hypothetical protein
MVELNRMPVMCDTEAEPAWAMLTLSPFFLTYSTKLLRSFAGNSFLATMTIGVPAARPTGAKSLVGSYLRFG